MLADGKGGFVAAIKGILATTFGRVQHLEFGCAKPVYGSEHWTGI